MKQNFEKWISDFLINFNLNETARTIIIEFIYLLAVTVFCFILYFILKIIILKTIKKITLKTPNKWDDAVFESGGIEHAIKIIPASIFYSFAFLFPSIKNFVETVLFIIISLLVFFTISSLLNAINIIYIKKSVNSKKKPIKGLLTVIKMAVFVIVLIVVIAKLLGQSPVYIISGLGALSAVIILVFKDSILGMVAGYQMAANDLVRIGDWIEMPKYGTDGEVVDISLTVVKVKNFDNTITTIPAYALVSDSFKNWREIFVSGGRRIKRAINIDLTSIKYCQEELLSALNKIEILKTYLKNIREEINNYNQINNVDTEIPINGRKLTNLGVFRKYLSEYLNNNAQINKNTAIMVRQLPPTQIGVPIEIYAFTKETQWVNYENLISDIFDHIFSVIPYFELRVFQEPSGSDIKALKEKI